MPKMLSCLKCFARWNTNLQKPWVSQKIDSFIQPLQLVKKINPVLVLICTDMSVRGELGHMFPFAHSKPFYEVSNFSTIISDLRYLQICSEISQLETFWKVVVSVCVCMHMCTFGGFLWGYGLRFHPILHKPFSFNGNFNQW